MPDTGDSQSKMREAQMSNMLGLVKFCLETTAKEDASGNCASNIGPMDEDRRAWLEEAISNMTLNTANQLLDHLANLKKIIAEMEKDPSKVTDRGELENDACLALKTLTMLCEEIDYAADFAKLDGFSIFEPLIGCSHLRLNVKACKLIAALAQNNPICQDMAIETSLLERLIDFVKTNQNPMKARSYAMYAISSIIRSNPKVSKHFEANLDGLSVLLYVLEDQTMKQSSDGNENLIHSKDEDEREGYLKEKDWGEKLLKRSIFLINTLCYESPIALEYFYENKVIIQINNHLKDSNESEIIEHLLMALKAFLTSLDRPRQVKSLELVPSLEDNLRLKLGNAPEEVRDDYDSSDVLSLCKDLNTLIGSLKQYKNGK